MANTIDLATDGTIGVSFDGMDYAILDTFNNPDVICPTVVLLAILIPVKGDDIPCLWRRQAILIPDP